MKIYTGNFANVKKYQEAGLLPISIARFNRYFLGIKYQKLAPPAEIIHVDEKNYIPLYEKMVLNTLSTKEVINDLMMLSGGKDVILLCYEKAGDFCHRRLVAKWIEEKENIIIPEFLTKIKEKQLSLL